MRKRVIVLTTREDMRGKIANGVRVAKAFYTLGYNVMIMEHGFFDEKKIEQADMILASGSLVYTKNVDGARIIHGAKRPNVPFVLWYFDACCPQWKSGKKRKYGNICKLIPYLDWLITTDHSYPWENHIGNYLHLMQGVDAEDFEERPPSHGNRQYDVIFAGNASGAHKERKALLTGLKEQFRVCTFGGDSGQSVYGRSFVKAHHKAKVVYVPAPPKIIPGPYWSNRIYLAAATGTPCVVGRTRGLSEHYMANKEVLYFDNASDLYRQIRRLLNSSRLRERMGKAARERTLQEHTYINRVETLMKGVFHNDI